MDPVTRLSSHASGAGVLIGQDYNDWKEKSFLFLRNNFFDFNLLINC